MNQRQGYSLIEMMAAMAISSTLLLLAIQLVHQAMRLDQTARCRGDLERVATRLTRDFRRDVEAATAIAEIDGADATADSSVDRLRLQYDASSLACLWTIEPEGVLRTALTTDGTTARREFYRLPADYRGRLQRNARTGQIVLDVVLESGKQTDDPISAVRVAASTARWTPLGLTAGDAP